MSDKENFLDFGNSLFSKPVIDAAREGRVNAKPMIERLDSTYAIAMGLERIFAIARANAIQSDGIVSNGGDDEMQPPLSQYTVDALLGMGAAVSKMMVGDLEDLARWANNNAVSEERK